MLSNTDLYDEIKKIEAIETDNIVNKAFLKIGTLALKLLHNIRTNQVAIMKNSGVELAKPENETATQK